MCTEKTLNRTLSMTGFYFKYSIILHALNITLVNHQARPSRNSWDLPNSYEVKASTYLIRSVQAAGAARLVNEVAYQRLKVWKRCPLVVIVYIDWANAGLYIVCWWMSAHRICKSLFIRTPRACILVSGFFDLLCNLEYRSAKCESYWIIRKQEK